MSPEQEVKDRMQAIGKITQSLIPPGWGFAVFAFPLSDREGDLNYVSNAQRDQFVTMMRNFVKRFDDGEAKFGEHQPDAKPV